MPRLLHCTVVSAYFDTVYKKRKQVAHKHHNGKIAMPRDSGLPDGENYMILRSLVLNQYQRVTNRWTDRWICL